MSAITLLFPFTWRELNLPRSKKLLVICTVVEFQVLKHVQRVSASNHITVAWIIRVNCNNLYRLPNSLFLSYIHSQRPYALHCSIHSQRIEGTDLHHLLTIAFRLYKGTV